MINTSQQTFYRLENLNAEQQRITYQTSTGKILEHGSDDSTLYAKEVYIDDKIKTYDGIKLQIQKTTAQNNVADSTIGEIKNLLDVLKTELLKANTATVGDEDKKSIAVAISGLKDNIYAAVNTQVEGEYLFSGSDSSVKSFEKDPTTGVISYNGDNLLRKVAVEEGSYRERGINGFDMLMYNSDIATKADPNLSFKDSDRILDENGNEWKRNGTTLEKYDLEGNLTNPLESITGLTNDGATPPTYTAVVGTPPPDGTRFETKTNIFGVIDDVLNALNKVDSLGNPINDATADAILRDSIDKVGDSYDYVNTAHAELGSRNKVLEISLERVNSKLTQFNVLSQELGAADLGKLAIETKALELTYTALYSTVNKTNQLSIVNFLK
ncbi:flagellar hook-associated protein 3 [Poseidonibacter sp.]|uniref:flagellin N-terminal helical domain-containing protein n=1 Tax=Poseidonibacter sp. TaxID=2321188 RepID=UPI003C7569FC